MNRIPKLLITLLALWAMPLLAAEGYLVTSEISVGGQVLGKPSISVTPGVQAKAAVENSYQLAVVANPTQSGEVFVETELTVGSATHRPSVLVKPGETTTVGIGDTSLSISVAEVVHD